MDVAFGVLVLNGAQRAGDNRHRIGGDQWLEPERLAANAIEQGRKRTQDEFVHARLEYGLVGIQKTSLAQSIGIVALEGDPIAVPADFLDRSVAVPHVGEQENDVAGVDRSLAGRLRFERALASDCIDDGVFVQNAAVPPYVIVRWRMSFRAELSVGWDELESGPGDEQPPMTVECVDRQIAELFSNGGSHFSKRRGGSAAVVQGRQRLDINTTSSGASSSLSLDNKYGIAAMITLAFGQIYIISDYSPL